MAATRDQLLHFQRQVSHTVFGHHQRQVLSPGFLRGTTTRLPSPDKNSLFTFNGAWKRGFATNFEEEKKFIDGYYAGVSRISQTHSSIFFKGTPTCHHHLLPYFKTNNFFTSKRGFATKSDSERVPFPWCMSGEEVKSSAKTYLMVPSGDGNLSSKITHTTCGTSLESVVSKTAYETGVVLVHCHGCNKIVNVVDHSGLFKKPECFKIFVASVEKQVKESAHKSMSFTVQFQSGSGLKFYMVHHDFKCGDLTVKFKHQCGALLESRISYEALETGMVVVPCDGCNQLVVFPDYGIGYKDFVKHTFGTTVLDGLEGIQARVVAEMREKGIKFEPK